MFLWWLEIWLGAGERVQNFEGPDSGVICGEEIAEAVRLCEASQRWKELRQKSRRPRISSHPSDTRKGSKKMNRE